MSYILWPEPVWFLACWISRLGLFHLRWTICDILIHIYIYIYIHRRGFGKALGRNEYLDYISTIPDWWRCILTVLLVLGNKFMCTKMSCMVHCTHDCLIFHTYRCLEWWVCNCSCMSNINHIFLRQWQCILFCNDQPSVSECDVTLFNTDALMLIGLCYKKANKMGVYKWMTSPN